ncbi:hypothetical protein Agub_g12823 [Astrephomene gubernaculifera]|uniref:non-specific serine/threonine protein kinase n=1 Tax=Astrephomene gubernaculifera TaxID=47775 RepID=A0AAD3DYV0_9CHLO|nr:hypothetical protein Agub_g12823 [Astrephomene gubernaculifera]
MPTNTAQWSSSDKQPEEVEESPNGRYIRYNILLGKGACKRVYKALDTEEGREVAWNQVELLGMEGDEEARAHLQEEIRVLQQLKHKNIMTFYAWWVDPGQQHINFITELFTAGNLRQYRKKLKIMSENVLKRWAHQILEGLLYLHGHVPPIVHRDLKCDNIFVNSATGQIKIGDLGLATVQQQGMSVVGTPEFMAPEVYDESYDERCDIYSFGMCLLELATQEYPYAECHSVPQIFKKVTLGIPPASLARVSSPELRDFISLCIAHNPADRPSARELLKHPYLEIVRQAAGGSSSNGGGGGELTSGGSASSLLAAAGSSCGGSGGGTGWNTPSGTLHCAASARDLREALHQQEALARHQHQQQQHLLHPHLSCPQVPLPGLAAALGGGTSPPPPPASASSPHIAAMTGPQEGILAMARSSSSGSGQMPLPSLPPAPLLVSQAALRRSTSGAGAIPPQPSPLGRSVSIRNQAGEPSQPPPQPPTSSSQLSRLGSGGVPAVVTVGSSPPACSSPRAAPRSRLGLTCDVGGPAAGGGGVYGSPPSPSTAALALSPAPTLSLLPEAVSAVQPAAAAAATEATREDLPCQSLPAVAAAAASGSSKPHATAAAPGEETYLPSAFMTHAALAADLSQPELPTSQQQQEEASAHTTEGPGSAAAPSGGSSIGGGRIGGGAAWDPVLGSATRPRLHSGGVVASRHGSECSHRSEVSGGGSGAGGVSTDGDDTDSDEEVLVPIELLKAGLLEEGFVESDHSQTSRHSPSRRSLSFSQTQALAQGAYQPSGFSRPSCIEGKEPEGPVNAAGQVEEGCTYGVARARLEEKGLQRDLECTQPALEAAVAHPLEAVAEETTSRDASVSLALPLLSGQPVAVASESSPPPSPPLERAARAAASPTAIAATSRMDNPVVRASLDGGNAAYTTAEGACNNPPPCKSVRGAGSACHSRGSSLDVISFSLAPGPHDSGASTPALRGSYSGQPQQQQQQQHPTHGGTSGHLQQPSVQQPQPQPPTTAEAAAAIAASSSRSSSRKFTATADSTTTSSTDPVTAAAAAAVQSPSLQVPSNAAVQSQALHQAHASVLTPPGSPTLGQASAVVPGPVRLPSFRNKVLMTVTSPPGSSGGAGGAGTSAAAAAAAAAQPLRHLRTTSARAMHGISGDALMRGVGSPPLPRSGAFGSAHGPRTLRVPQFPAAAAGGSSAAPVSAAPEGDAALAGLFNLPPLQQPRLFERTLGRSGNGNSLTGGGGGSDSSNSCFFQRSASLPLTPVPSIDAAAPCSGVVASSLPGGDVPFQAGTVTTGSAAEGVSALLPAPAAAEERSLPVPEGSFGLSTLEALAAGRPLSSGGAGADGLLRGEAAACPTSAAATVTQQLRRQNQHQQEGFTRSSDGDNSSSGVLTGLWRGDVDTIASTPATAATAATEAAAAAAAAAGLMRYVPHSALMPLKEDSAELAPPSPRVTTSGGGGEGGSVGGDSRRGGSAAGFAADMAGVGDGEMTVVREFARPIQGVIMRFKQLKRLVGDKAKAFRTTDKQPRM